MCSEHCPKEIIVRLNDLLPSIDHVPYSVWNFQYDAEKALKYWSTSIQGNPLLNDKVKTLCASILSQHISEFSLKANASCLHIVFLNVLDLNQQLLLPNQSRFRGEAVYSQGHHTDASWAWQMTLYRFVVHTKFWTLL